MKNNIIPIKYKKNELTKVLYLYKIGLINREEFIKCTEYLKYWLFIDYETFTKDFIKEIKSETRKYYGHTISYILKEQKNFSTFEKKIIDYLLDKKINNYYGTYTKYYNNCITLDYWTD